MGTTLLQGRQAWRPWGGIQGAVLLLIVLGMETIVLSGMETTAERGCGQPSAPPQLVQLVGHVFQLGLDGGKALQLLVLQQEQRWGNREQ